MSRGALPKIIEIESGEGRRSIVTPSLRLTFHWEGDRWSHRLEVNATPVAPCLARSIEAGPGEDDSARSNSPVYQHLTFQRGASGVQALLVGQAGARHDSAAFTVREAPDGVIVEADVASRSRSTEPVPCCAYIVAAAPGDLRDAGPARIVWEFPSQSPLPLSPGERVPGGRVRGSLEGETAPAGRLVFESATPPDPPALLTLAESGRRATHVQADPIVVPGSATQRLGYRWRWTVSPHTLPPTPGNTEGTQWIS